VLLTTHYLDEAQHLASRVIVLDDGKVVADATPEALRAMGGLPVIRYRLPATAPGLPAPLAGHVDRGELTLPSADVTADLSALAGWARQNQVDLTGVEVGSRSLEDAYLALTSEKTSHKEGALSHGLRRDRKAERRAAEHGTAAAWSRAGHRRPGALPGDPADAHARALLAGLVFPARCSRSSWARSSTWAATPPPRPCSPPG
jgi:ABC-type sulfate/molybdate transport systems ATPase subunit